MLVETGTTVQALGLDWDWLWAATWVASLILYTCRSDAPRELFLCHYLGISPVLYVYKGREWIDWQRKGFVLLALGRRRDLVWLVGLRKFTQLARSLTHSLDFAVWGFSDCGRLRIPFCRRMDGSWEEGIKRWCFPG